eukprot:CAMPEP_0202691188 /NCGR_PEP_ID=MMETSP1385-20130828/5974_1 /ASSEMBLY_ACC=CAM_ASM_000861 /TAXON_ID=933848 /ORGANISM="Elphidium margaritaceum" /LENGTH=385 /DNA_ID=CAMNT_0049346555 /DNA_START=18 /DNA_END=1175 /DNA_ORIENTATION=+
MHRTNTFLLRWLDTVESLGFILCTLLFLTAIYHIYFQRIERNVPLSRTVTKSRALTITTNSSRSSKGRTNGSVRKEQRGHNHKLNNKIKWSALISMIFYSLACVTDILTKDKMPFSSQWIRAFFVSTQCCFALATITSYLLFVAQLHITYNESGSAYCISKTAFIALFTMIAIFAAFMLCKSVLLLFVKDAYLSPEQYGKIGAAMLYGASLTDICLTLSMLYLFNSRLTTTIKQSLCSTFKAPIRKLLSVRLKMSILTAFGLVSTQCYLIVWSVTALIWYNYHGANKAAYVYDMQIATITFRVIACITNSSVILFNFGFANSYYECCCYAFVRCCSWDENSGHPDGAETVAFDEQSESDGECRTTLQPQSRSQGSRVGVADAVGN